MVGGKVLVDVGETHKLFLVYTLYNGGFDGRQHGVFFGELWIEVFGGSLALLQKRNRHWCQTNSILKSKERKFIRFLV